MFQDQALIYFLHEAFYSICPFSKGHQLFMALCCYSKVSKQLSSGIQSMCICTHTHQLLTDGIYNSLLLQTIPYPILTPQAHLFGNPGCDEIQRRDKDIYFTQYLFSPYLVQDPVLGISEQDTSVNKKEDPCPCGAYIYVKYKIKHIGSTQCILTSFLFKFLSQYGIKEVMFTKNLLCAVCLHM